MNETIVTTLRDNLETAGSLSSLQAPRLDLLDLPAEEDNRNGPKI